MGEDYYEQDHGHYADPRYYWRWLYWSWTLAGGSGNYCGRWGVIHPIQRRRATTSSGSASTTTTTRVSSWSGWIRSSHSEVLQEAQHRPGALHARREPRHDVDGRHDRQRPIGTHRGDREILVYHPNSLGDGQDAVVDTSRAAGIHLDLTDYHGTYKAEWLRAIDGVVENGPAVAGGSETDLTAPWRGYDVVLRLVKK
jgi:hypothetical protein